MSADELLSMCRQAGIRLEAAGNMLEIDAPRGALTPELRDLLARGKRELLALLAPSSPYVVTDAGVQARRDVFERQLAATPAPRVPMFLFKPDVAYTRGRCYSCDAPLPEPRYGRCWRCSFGWRLACRLPIDPVLADARDAAKVVG